MCLLLQSGFFFLQAQRSVLTATVFSWAPLPMSQLNVEDNTLFCEVSHGYFQIWGKMRRRKTRTQKCCRDSPAVKTHMNDLEVEWKSVCNVPCYDGLNACVGGSEMNIPKLLRKSAWWSLSVRLRMRKHASHWQSNPHWWLQFFFFFFFLRELQLQPFRLKVSYFFCISLFIHKGRFFCLACS